MTSSRGTSRLFRRRPALFAPLALMATASGAASMVAACAPPGSVAGVGSTELFVSLGRSRSLAVVDTVRGRVVARLPGTPAGWESPAGQLAASSRGQLAMLPLNGRINTVGVAWRTTELTSRRESDAGWGATLGVRASGQNVEDVRYAELGIPPTSTVDGGAPAPQPRFAERALLIDADAQGSAYAFVTDPVRVGPGSIAVLDLTTGTVARQFRITEPGETVVALAVHPSGKRLYTSVWQFRSPDDPDDRWRVGSGFLVAVDPADGAVVARTPLPDQAIVMSMAYVPPAAQGAQAWDGSAASFRTGSTWSAGERLMALLMDPPPNQLRDDWGLTEYHSMLMAFDAGDLTQGDVWPTGAYASSVALAPAIRRAFILRGRGVDSHREVLALDLASGATTSWAVPSMTLQLTATPTGRVYAADLERDRLLAFDTRTASPLAPVELGDAPVALAACPV